MVRRDGVPSLGPALATLWSVTATSGASAWAVGSYVFGNNRTGTLILHWNGASWKREPAPNPPDSDLLSVTATSAANAWAVGGYTGNSIVEHTLIEHWNGRTWRQVAAPSPQENVFLFGVGARSGSGAFAVSATVVGDTYLARWNGRAWREVTSPPPIFGLLGSVAFGSANRAWVVGTNLSLSTTAAGHTLIERWNGATWG